MQSTHTIACVALLLLPCCGDAAPTQSSSAARTATSSTSPPQAIVSATATTAAAAPEEIAAQHVLVAYKGAKNASGVTRSKAEAKKLAQQVHDDAVKGGDFGELAKQHSDDPASKERLGSLGKFKRSEMVKQFSDVAFALAVGAVSEVIETEFGFHVIKRNQ